VIGLEQGWSGHRGRALSEHLGIDRRTLERWRHWWREEFCSGSFWKMARGFLSDIDDNRVPHELLVRFAGHWPERLCQTLRFLSPISTQSVEVDVGF
jgi:hypothetical protein